MKCIICNQENIEYRLVDEIIKKGNNIVYVKVDALVCSTCGERYYNRNTIQFLEKVEEEIMLSDSKLKEVGKVLMYG